MSVADQVEKGELSYKEAQEHYGIQGNERSDVVLQARPAGLESKHILWLTEDGDNAYIERYNRTVRYDWLGHYLFESITVVQEYAIR